MTTFCQRSLDFLYFNHLNNSKAWYAEHKEDFRQYLYAPFCDIVREMTPSMLQIDEGFITEPRNVISRLYKDLRFAKDKTSLYRDCMWFTFMRDKNQMYGLPGYFFELSPYGFRYGCGYYCADAKSMASMRNLILSNSKSFKNAKKCFENQDIFQFVGETYKKPHYPDYPQDVALWLEKKDMCFIANSHDIDLLFSPDLAKTLCEQFMVIKPLYDFMMLAESMTER